MESDGRQTQPARRRGARAARLLAVLLLAVVALRAWPALARGDVLAVIAEHSPAYEEVLAATRAGLADALGRRLTLRVLTAAEFTQNGPREPDRGLPDLVVTVGTSAAGAVLAARLPVPVYCTLLPRAAYEALAQEAGPHPAGRASALYLDQPFVRQMRLLRLALSSDVRVGAVLGPESRQNEPGLRRAAAAAGLALHVERVREERQLVRGIYRVMEDSDVLLAVPDPLVFNRHTAQNVLLTTYRIGKPVAGYSRAYVDAGALLAVYSTPEQVGRELGEWLLARADHPGRPLPPPRYPRYFTVEVNERVARSLGLEVGRVEDLQRRLMEGAAGDES